MALEAALDYYENLRMINLSEATKNDKKTSRILMWINTYSSKYGGCHDADCKSDGSGHFLSSEGEFAKRTRLLQSEGLMVLPLQHE